MVLESGFAIRFLDVVGRCFGLKVEDLIRVDVSRRLFFRKLFRLGTLAGRHVEQSIVQSEDADDRIKVEIR